MRTAAISPLPPAGLPLGRRAPFYRDAAHDRRAPSAATHPRPGGIGRSTTGRSVGTLHTRSDRKRVTGTLSLDGFWAAIDGKAVDRSAE